MNYRFQYFCLSKKIMKAALFLTIFLLLSLPKEVFAHDHCDVKIYKKGVPCHFFEKTIDAIWSPWGGFAAGFLARAMSEENKNRW